MKREHLTHLRKFVWSGIFLIILIVLLARLGYLIRENEAFREAILTYGYPGIFLISLVSGFNIVVPIPAITFLPIFLRSGLDFWITITIIAIGMTTADMIAYYLGRFNSTVTSEFWNTETFKKLLALQERHPWVSPIVLFIYASTAPLPNELLVTPMGFLGYHSLSVFVPVLLGNFCFNLLYSTGVITAFEFL